MTIDIRALAPDETGAVDARLPLSRLDAGTGFYVVAWDGDEPVGHAHFAATDPPEVQDMWVPPELRGRGIGTALLEEAERTARDRGHSRITLSVSAANGAARRLYERAGYRDSGLPPKRVKGTILLRGEPFDVDDTLVYLEKNL